MKAFHFTNGMKLRDGEELIVGKTYRYEGEIEICKSGYHASKNIVDALKYSPGFTLSIVECEDIVKEHVDKFVCRTRFVLETQDIRDEILLWAANCAEDALKTIETPDKRTLDAIQGVRDFVAGKITKEELIGIRYNSAAYAARAARAAAYSKASYAALVAYYAANTGYVNSAEYYAANTGYVNSAEYYAALAASDDVRSAKMKEYEQKLLESIQKKFENKLD